MLDIGRIIDMRVIDGDKYIKSFIWFMLTKIHLSPLDMDH